MHNLGTFFLWTLAACLLWHGSLANNLRPGYACILEDPNTNKCDSFCLNELRPMLRLVIKGQDRGNNRDADKEIKAKLSLLEAKMGEVQANLKGQQTVLTKIENQLQAILSKIEAPRQATKVAIPIAPSGFERIGTRYFKIVHEPADWDTARRRCREMGGYLASIRNEEEFNALKAKIQERIYWLGINDRNTEGHFVSVASQKPAQFLRWISRRPDDGIHAQNCISLTILGMTEFQCYQKIGYICQADNET